MPFFRHDVGILLSDSYMKAEKERPELIGEMYAAFLKSKKLYSHMLNYPEKWNAELFYKWAEEYEKKRISR